MPPLILSLSKDQINIGGLSSIIESPCRPAG